MKDLDRGAARQALMEKQALEVGMSLDLLEIFDDTLLPDLRDLCLASMLRVDDRLAHSVTFQRRWDAADWQNYACFRGTCHFGWDLDVIAPLVATWSASECGDWIRVYGEIVEEQFLGEGENVQRKAAQRGPEGLWVKAQPNVRPQSLNQPQFKPEALRRRLKTSTLWSEQLALYEANDTPSKGLMSSMPMSGISKWAIMSGDIVGRMDQVFGLMTGATISGTTTDNVYFLADYGKLIGDPVYNMLPLATIVGGGHHSLLEVAMPMTLNGLCDYVVGLYTTLMPARDAAGSHDAAATEIAHLLKTYEDRQENRLLLCYYRGAGHLDGCFVAETPAQQRAWTEEFKLDGPLVREFMGMRDWPTRGDIETFALRHRLG